MRKKNNRLRFFTRKKLAFIGIILLIALLLWNLRDILFSPYPGIVNNYRNRYKEMNTPEYLEKLRKYINETLHDPIDGLNYTELLGWIKRHLMYYEGYLQARPEMPLEILITNELGYIKLKNDTKLLAIFCHSTGQVTVLGQITQKEFNESKWISLNMAVGRCGEFALLYNGLLLANGLRSRIVVDCSVKTDDRLAGDHVWNEVLTENGTWVHVDTVEASEKYPNFDNYINHAEMYRERWNKNINCVYAIEGDVIEDVTSKYA